MTDWFGSGQSGVIVNGASAVETRPLMRFVYMWMTLGLLVTAAVAWVVPNTPALLELVMNRAVFFGAIIVELALVIGLSWGLNRMSANLAGMLFFVYAAVNGFTLSVIFLVYDIGSIAEAFLITAGMFGVMTVFAFTTKLDLSRYGSILMMALIGLVIAMLVNTFLGSSGLNFIISLGGVVLFSALTAYDTQKIKNMAAMTSMSDDGSLTAKLGIMGALTLYLDFINLFLFLLRLLGRRD